MNSDNMEVNNFKSSPLKEEDTWDGTHFLQTDGQTDFLESNSTSVDVWTDDEKFVPERTKDRKQKNKKRDVSTRKMRPPCSACKFKCTSKFTEDERQGFFDYFWSLGDYGKQKLFLAQSTDSIKSARRIYPQQDRKPRECNYAFYFEMNSLKIRVCKLFYVNTLGINGRPFRTLRNKLNNRDDILLDRRGRHGKQRKIDGKVVEEIRNFVDERYNSTLKPSVSAMYNEYVDKVEEENRSAISYTSFMRIYRGEHQTSQPNPPETEKDVQQDFDMDTAQGLISTSSLKAKEPFTFSTELIKLDPEAPNHDNLNSEFGRGSSPLRTPKVEILSDVEDATPQQEPETDPIDIESAENRLNSNEIEMDPIDSFFTAMATSVKTLPTILQVQVKQKVAAAVFEAESAFISGKF